MDIGNEKYRISFREFIFKIRYWLILAFIVTLYFFIKDIVTRREILVHDIEGSYLYTIKTNEGKTIWDAPEIEVPEGYAIVWYSSLGTNADRVSFPLSVGDETALYPVLVGNLYRMVFDPMNGDDPISIIRRIGSQIAPPEDPVKPGYMFAGWYEEDSPTAYEITTMPLDGVYLYARWIRLHDE